MIVYKKIATVIGGIGQIDEAVKLYSRKKLLHFC
jgi:hypothetical protein